MVKIGKWLKMNDLVKDRIKYWMIQQRWKLGSVES